MNECVALAIKICITINPKCTFCSEPAQTAHHFIRQSRSNYLRCDQKNLVSICGKHHASIHVGQNEGELTLRLNNIRGKAWSNYIIANKSKSIKSDMFYWTKMKILLEAELNELLQSP